MKPQNQNPGAATDDNGQHPDTITRQPQLNIDLSKYKKGGSSSATATNRMSE